MKTKLNEIYEEIDVEFMKNKNLDNYSKRIENDIEIIDQKIEKCDKEIIGKKVAINKLIEKSKKEKNEERRNEIMQKALDQRKKIASINKEKIILEEKRKKISKKKQNVEGYTKNKNQIEKIKKYKVTLEKKVSDVNGKTQLTKHNLEVVNQSIKIFSEKLTTNEKILKAHEETVKKLKKELTYLEKQSKINIMNKSENCVKELTNKRIQINKAERDLKQKENIVNDIKKSYQEKINEANKLKEIIQNYDKEMAILKGVISKCDLAWKTLFVNKDWDEINKRVIENGKCYTESKAKQEKNKNKEEVKKLENQEEVKKEEKEGKKEEKIEQEEKSLVKVEKTNIFKRIVNAIRNLKPFKSKIITDTKWNGEVKSENTELGNVEFESEEIETEKTEKEKNKKDRQDSKDAFIEALRLRVDDDYKKLYDEIKEKHSNNYNEKRNTEKDNER